MDEPVETLQQTTSLVTRFAIEYGPRLLAAALVLVAGWFLTRWVARIAGRGLDRLTLEPPVKLLLLRVLRALVFALFLLIRRFLVGAEVEGVFTLFAILFFFIGIIIMGIGIVGEYVGRIYQEVRKRPRFVVRKTYGFDEQ